MKRSETYVVVRGAGDLASGVIQKLYRAKFKVIALEIESPLAIRRTVALSEAIYQNETTVEDIKAKKIEFSKKNIDACLDDGYVPVLIDPKAELIKEIKPFVLVDAILAKRNLGTYRNMANIVIGLGPGFSAPNDVHAVIETMRGHNLGRLILSGSAIDNTSIPGSIDGISKERVVYSPISGVLHTIASIGDRVDKGDLLCMVGNIHVKSPISGVVRGLLRNGYNVPQFLKIADIDPRIQEISNCYTVSDKARCLGGAVLEAIFALE